MIKWTVKRLEEHNKELIWAKEDLKDENRELKKRIQELVENKIDNCLPGSVGCRVMQSSLWKTDSSQREPSLLKRDHCP
jgi:hypothetical protein